MSRKKTFTLAEFKALSLVQSTYVGGDLGDRKVILVDPTRVTR